jgi:DNA-binding LacI/PurR family transcriptional regulator
VTRRVLEASAPPTALIYDNDVMALAGVAAATELGHSVPGDVSVVAWEDSALCRMVKPWLSALSRDSVEFGGHGTDRAAGRRPGADRPGTGAPADRAGQHGSGS